MSRDTGKEREQKGGTGPCPGASSTELMELNTGGGAVRLSTPPPPPAQLPGHSGHTPPPPHTPLQPGVQDRRARARTHTHTHTHTPNHPPSRLLGSLSHSGQDSHSVTPQSLSQPPPEQRPAGPKTADRGGGGKVSVALPQGLLLQGEVQSQQRTSKHIVQCPSRTKSSREAWPALPPATYALPQFQHQARTPTPNPAL